jgi:uncharacterized protein (TIGR03435 family)
LLTLMQAQSMPKFEVASVKPVKFGGLPRGGCHGVDSVYPRELASSLPPLGRCVFRDASLEQMVSLAYRFHAPPKGAPAWAREDGPHFDVEGIAEDAASATEAELYQMFQALLIERFRIKLHVETRQVGGFALVIARGGPKLQDTPPGQPWSYRVVSATAISVRKFTMPWLAGLVGNVVGSPVVDRTGLAGSYDLDLSWDEQNGPSMATVLRELGLRLESQKVPEPFVVIESAQMPTEN